MTTADISFHEWKPPWTSRLGFLLRLTKIKTSGIVHERWWWPPAGTAGSGRPIGKDKHGLTEYPPL